MPRHGPWATLPVKFVAFERRSGETNRQQARRWRKLHGTHERRLGGIDSSRRCYHARAPLWARERFFDQLRMLRIDLAGKGMEGYA